MNVQEIDRKKSCGRQGFVSRWALVVRLDLTSLVATGYDVFRGLDGMKGESEIV